MIVFNKFRKNKYKLNEIFEVGKDITPIQNIILELEVEFLKFTYFDRKIILNVLNYQEYNLHTHYNISFAGFETIVKSLHDGKYKGLFTFSRSGGTIIISPATDKEPEFYNSVNLNNDEEYIFYP